MINSLRLGGAEGVFLTELSYLGELGCNVHCITVNGPNRYLIDCWQNLSLHTGHRLDLDRVREVDRTNEYHCLDGEGEVSIKTALNLAQYTRSNGITCLYTTLDRSIKIALLAKLFYGSFRLIVREARTYDQKPLYLKLLNKALGRLVDQYVAVSCAVRDSMPSKFRQCGGKVIVLTNGVSVLWQRLWVEPVMRWSMGAALGLSIQEIPLESQRRFKRC